MLIEFTNVMGVGCPLSPSGSVRSPYSSLSLTASMQLVDEILSDQRIEKMDKIERLEAILSGVAGSNTSPSITQPSSIETSNCNCDCHHHNTRILQDSPTASGKIFSEVGSQTLSTGDIVITKVYFPEATDTPAATPS